MNSSWSGNDICLAFWLHYSLIQDSTQKGVQIVSKQIFGCPVAAWAFAFIRFKEQLSLTLVLGIHNHLTFFAAWRKQQFDRLLLLKLAWAQPCNKINRPKFHWKHFYGSRAEWKPPPKQTAVGAFWLWDLCPVKLVGGDSIFTLSVLRSLQSALVKGWELSSNLLWS